MTDTRTPLKPNIALRRAPDGIACGCCRSDASVLIVSLGWSVWPGESADHPDAAGGRRETALCIECRGKLRWLLECEGAPMPSVSGERLSNDLIADIARLVGEGEYIADAVEPAEVLAMVREIQARRAADLTAQDIEHLRDALAAVLDDGEREPMGAFHKNAAAVLMKILESHGAKP